MENDLISRNALLDTLQNHFGQDLAYLGEDLQYCQEAVQFAPAVEAEPVRHGRWVWHEDWGHPSISEPQELLDAYWVCSECRTDLLQYLKSHFPDIPSYTECSEEVPTLERCPNCGAKMDGGAE